MVENPILRNIKYSSIYFTIWMFFIISSIFVSLYNRADLNVTLIDNLLSYITLALLGLSFWYTTKYITLEEDNLIKNLLIHFGTGLVISLIWCLLVILIEVFVIDSKYTFTLYKNLPYKFLIGALVYYLLTAFYYNIIYYSNLQQKLERETELNNLVTSAEIKSLKFQINPHFIFNSLNSISALTSIEPELARSMIIKLADFLRYTLSNNDKQQNKLSEELRNINLYLDIEKIRFEDKFNYVCTVPEECNDILVPNMILQPLFENAIKHAVYETLSSVTLNLHCKKRNDFLIIALSNNYDKNSKPRKGSGVGIENIRTRLELIYGLRDLLKIIKTDNHFTAEMKIPIRYAS